MKFNSNVGGIIALLALGAIGCSSSGVGRDTASNEYARYVSSLYNEPAVNHGPRTIEFPVNIAVAQVGESAPSQKVIEKLRAAPDVFHHVLSLPADFLAGATPSSYSRDPVQRLQSLARDQGADYLLIYGATVVTHARLLPTSGLDLTIVGAFVVPSREVEADARASAALIDVRSGTVVLTAGGQASDSTLATAVTTDAEVDRVQGRSAAGSYVNLVDQLVVEARRRTADENALGDNNGPVSSSAK